MVCSICKQHGHNKRSCKITLSEKKESNIIENNMSRGKNSFKNGKAYQSQIALKLNTVIINDLYYKVEEVSGAKSGPDIIIKGTPHGDIGFEIKTRGAFEGGSSKMEYDNSQNRLVFLNSKLHQHYLGNTQIYDGKNLPWYEGKRDIESYINVSNIFNKEIHINLPINTVSEYYKNTRVHYIQVQGYGLYHTGNDILNLDVPHFECEQYLRIRTSKHKVKISNNIRIPTDVVGDINYNKKTLIKSNYDLDGKLPQSIKLVEE